MGKLQVSTKSWHYRFIDGMIGDVKYREDLCSYLRGFTYSCLLIGLLLVLPFNTFIISAFYGTDWLFMTQDTAKLVDGVAIKEVRTILSGNAWLSGFVAVICTIFALFRWGDTLRDIFTDRYWGYKGDDHTETIPKPKKTQKQRNLFWEWLKAKKQRVCPMVEFVKEGDVLLYDKEKY